MLARIGSFAVVIVAGFAVYALFRWAIDESVSTSATVAGLAALTIGVVENTLARARHQEAEANRWKERWLQLTHVLESINERLAKGR